MTERRRQTARGYVLLGLAVLVGAGAGLAAVYSSKGFRGHVAATASAQCARAAAAARVVDPLAKGEVAAFRVSQQPEDFSALAFKDAAGADTTLASLAGRTVLVNVWATWCVPCRKEMPTLDRLQAAFADDGCTVAAITLDIGAAGAERAKAFLDEAGIKSLSRYADPTTNVFKSLKERGLAFGLPTSILVDRKGCTIGIMQGPAEWDSEDAKALIGAAITVDQVS